MQTTPLGFLFDLTVITLSSFMVSLYFRPKQNGSHGNLKHQHKRYITSSPHRTPNINSFPSRLPKVPFLDPFYGVPCLTVIVPLHISGPKLRTVEGKLPPGSHIIYLLQSPCTKNCGRRSFTQSLLTPAYTPFSQVLVTKLIYIYRNQSDYLVFKFTGLVTRNNKLDGRG